MITKKIDKILGKKIYLKLLEPNDVKESYLKWINDPKINQFLEVRWQKFDIKKLKKYVEKNINSPTDYLFGIFIKSTHQHIGNIKIGNIHPKHKYADLGLLIGEKNLWGQGYATEAIYLVYQFAFNKLKLNKLIAGINELNKGSLKVFYKTGFKKSGQLKEHTIYKCKYVDTILVEKIKGKT